jgi:cell division protein FtsB
MNLRKLAVLPLFLLALYLIFHLSRSIWVTYRRTDRLSDLRQEITQLEGEKERLESERARRQTAAYVEEEARNRLNMVREGERMVVFPGTPKDAELNAEERRNSPAPRPKANWRKWVKYWVD